MYSKGANMLHTIRQIVNDDEKWRQVLRGLNKTFYHQTVKAEQIENYMSEQTGIDMKPIFDQYLCDIRIPAFEYGLIKNQLRYRWSNCIRGFNMKVKVYINGKPVWLKPNPRWQNLDLEEPFQTLKVDPDFYIADFLLVEAE